MIKNEQTRIFKQLLLITDLTSHILSTIPVQARKSCRTSLWENSLIDSFKNRKIWKSYSAGTQAFMLTNKLVKRAYWCVCYTRASLSQMCSAALLSVVDVWHWMKECNCAHSFKQYKGTIETFNNNNKDKNSNPESHFLSVITSADSLRILTPDKQTVHEWHGRPNYF